MINPAANLGNFLTHPQHRGKGYAKAVVRTLVHHLLNKPAN
jgi:predicted GNAT family acetyltransferase